MDLPRNEYYENISANLGILQVILYFSLFAFVFLSFLRNTNLITYQNFYYFFKDLNASAETVDVLSNDAVTYQTSDEQSFTLYRKGLAVAGNTSVTVFTATGRQTVSQIINYRNPVAVGSGKYLLVYEMGGMQYSLYNSYTQIHSGKTDAPISGAAISDSGMYALISEAAEYTSVVSLYNDRFTLINRYNKKGFVMDVSIRERGDLIAILTSTPNNGAFQTQLELYEPGKTTLSHSVKLGSTLAYACQFTSSGRISVLCSDGISIVNSNGTLETEFHFDGRGIADADLTPNGAYICLSPRSASEKNRMIVFDKNGKVLYNKDESETVEKVSGYGDVVYFLSIGKIGRLDVSTGRITYLNKPTEQRSILAVNEEDALLCTPQKAEYIHFGS